MEFIWLYAMHHIEYSCFLRDARREKFRTINIEELKMSAEKSPYFNGNINKNELIEKFVGIH